mgnify:FL=1
MKKQFNIIFYLSFLVIYLEILTKIFVTKSVSGIFLTLLFSIPLILILYLLANIFKRKGNVILTYMITITFIFYYCFQFFFHKLFSNVFSFNTLGLASNALDFTNIIFDVILKNIWIVLLYLLPLILLIIFHKRINFERTSLKWIIVSFILCLVIWISSLFCLFINKENTYSAYNLYYNINSEMKTVETFGLYTYTRLDIKRVLFGFEEKLSTIDEPDIPTEEDPKDPIEEITYNEIEIDFDSLIANESNETIKSMLEYFKNTEATNKNEYTGMFKGKNLIFLLAEGFNMIAVDPELTPTLYKLTHEGFVFNNFYSPVFLSTTGGEFQATTGLIPTQAVLSDWKKLEPTISYGLGNAFSKLGYTANGYHNWTYTYYSRQKTMETLGFNSYMGCGNGMEDLINCSWLPSDVDMINATLPLYQDSTPFVTYYVTVSGHAPYAYNSTGNSIALKNIDLVKDLPYSNNVKAYLATQIELDRALESLISGLEDAGILEDTVIALVGDHYPYTLTIDEINEISDYDRDEIVEVNRSDFIIWNSEAETIEVDKVGSQIDVLPTLLNLFGVEYDSRLIVGKDILSDAPGIAIFSNRSWVSDYGTYKNGKFTLKEGMKLENINEYVSSINNLVSNRFTLSANIIKYNMYDYLLN